MAGTRRLVHLAIVRMPPMMTRPVTTASARPMIHVRPAKMLASPPVESTMWAASWLDWKMLPAPSEANMKQNA